MLKLSNGWRRTWRSMMALAGSLDGPGRSRWIGRPWQIIDLRRTESISFTLTELRYIIIWLTSALILNPVLRLQEGMSYSGTWPRPLAHLASRFVDVTATCLCPVQVFKRMIRGSRLVDSQTNSPVFWGWRQEPDRQSYQRALWRTNDENSVWGAVNGGRWVVTSTVAPQ